MLKQSRTWQKKMMLTEAFVEDASGTIKAVWFNQPYLANTFKEGQSILLSGKAALKDKALYMASPAHEIKQAGYEDTIHTGRLVPVYPETAGVSSRWFRYAISKLLDAVEKFDDPLPKELRDKKNLPEINTALSYIHFPENLQQAKHAKHRFVFEELLIIQLAAIAAKQKNKTHAAPKIETDIALTKKFVGILPYTLTDSQKKSAWRILRDMEGPQAMNRLLEGDVGSGKTIVAAIAALNAVNSGYQVALMAPTEILAEQHFQNFKKLFAIFNINVELYTHNKKPRLDMRPDIAIGTHALIQKNVTFKNLGLVIIDEQHRFGVNQRASLQTKNYQLETGASAHFLSMTATPIPRTLALTLYGDLDISILHELPAGRKKIETHIIAPEARNEAYSFIRKELDGGRQAFVIFPLIEKSKYFEARAAVVEFEKLSQGPFKNYKLALLHGRMKTKEKEQIMRDFKEKKTQILVSTSVVEVGIDVPNATVMMIESTERFGLAQLHQFRGRVGRSEYQSYCMLLTDTESTGVRHRLHALKAAKNGFELAEYDLKLRGPGELYGLQQSGIGDLTTQALGNIKLVEEVHEEAEKLLAQDATLKSWPTLAYAVEQKNKILHFE